MHSFLRSLLIVAAMLAAAAVSSAQTNQPKPKPTPVGSPIVDLQPIKSSPAYAELLLRKTEIESDLDSLLVDHTEEYPKVKSIRIELSFLKVEIDRLLVVRPTEAEKLTLALGRLMLRKVELETEVVTLRAQYNDDHPEVRKARKKVETFESAIKEILG